MSQSLLYQGSVLTGSILAVAFAIGSQSLLYQGSVLTWRPSQHLPRPNVSIPSLSGLRSNIRTENTNAGIRASQSLLYQGSVLT